jgi:protoheme IX farnesyltransferase
VGFLFIVGVGLGFFVNSLMVMLLVISVILYNGFYTLIWKKQWAFGAVPGAIPGAMPVVVGFSAHSPELWKAEVLYAFSLVFLWQMPHYWALAVRYSKEYHDAGVPVLPTVVGVEKTLYQIGLYTFVYVGLAIAMPWFLPVSFGYLILVLPFAFKVLWEFFQFYADRGGKRWAPFFLWTTFSILFFLLGPVIDRYLVVKMS